MKRILLAALVVGSAHAMHIGEDFWSSSEEIPARTNDAQREYVRTGCLLLHATVESHAHHTTKSVKPHHGKLTNSAEVFQIAVVNHVKKIEKK